MAIAAEKILYIDPTSCIINCRRAMEFAIKWMYSVDASLTMPYQDNLISLMSTEEFRDIIDEDLMKRMDFIRKMGNNTYKLKKLNITDVIAKDLSPFKFRFGYTLGTVAIERYEHIEKRIK